MSQRLDLIKKIMQNQEEIRSISKKIKRTYYAGGDSTGVDQATYERSMKEMEKLNNGIYDLKKEVAKLPKENNESEKKLKAELEKLIASGKDEGKRLQEKLKDLPEGWGRNNLYGQQSELGTAISHAETILSLL